MTTPDDDRPPSPAGTPGPAGGGQASDRGPGPRRRGRGPRIALVATGAAAIAVLAGVAAGAAAWAIWNTEDGARWLLAHVPGVMAVDVQGTLGGGDLRVGSLRVAASDTRVDIDALRLRGLRLAFRPAPGVWLGLHLDALEAASVHVVPLPSKTPPHPATPPRTLRSPVSVAVDRVQVDALAVGTNAPLRDLTARVALGADGG